MKIERDILRDVPGQTEDALQQKCYFWFYNEFPFLRGLLFSVPNGGVRDPVEQQKLKATGLTNGVSDLIFLFRTNAYFIEIKKDEHSYQSKAQQDWQAKVEGQGFNYFIVRSLKDFKRLIMQLIY